MGLAVNSGRDAPEVFTVDTFLRDRAACSALHDAAIEGNVECLRVLLKAGADPNVLNAFGRTPLDFASNAPSPLKPPKNVSEIVEVLREYGGR
jgi:ankyrin repeat protein